MLLRDVIERKGKQVYCCSPNDTLQQVVEILSRHNIGSLVVLQDEQLVGIITERDILRAAAAFKHDFGSQPVSKCMTTEVTTAEEAQSITDIMGLMTEQRIRHLPILAEGGLAGMVSIGDIVKAQHDALIQENHHLMNYIMS